MQELADKVAAARAEHGLDTRIVHAPNPRVEKDEHYYNAKHQRLLDLGLQPHYLQETLIEDVIARVEHPGEDDQPGGAAERTRRRVEQTETLL